MPLSGTIVEVHLLLGWWTSQMYRIGRWGPRSIGSSFSKANISALQDLGSCMIVIGVITHLAVLWLRPPSRTPTLDRVLEHRHWKTLDQTLFAGLQKRLKPAQIFIITSRCLFLFSYLCWPTSRGRCMLESNQGELFSVLSLAPTAVLVKSLGWQPFLTILAVSIFCRMRQLPRSFGHLCEHGQRGIRLSC